MTVKVFEGVSADGEMASVWRSPATGRFRWVCSCGSDSASGPTGYIDGRYEPVALVCCGCRRRYDIPKPFFVEALELMFD
jgi:hypothetical protein